MDEIKLGYVFGQGICQNKNTIRIISHFDELANYGSTSSSLMMLSRKKNQWHHFNLGWRAIRLACSRTQMFALGEAGELLRADASGVVEEQIPDVSGSLRDMRLIGEHIYVAGTHGQIKKRIAEGKWADWAEGLENQSELSFNRIHGLDESEIYAVGDSGKIHRCLDGVWREITSPTDADLSNVVAIEKGEAYATGKDGILLHIRDDDVRIAARDESLKTLFGIAAFSGKIYFATETAIYRLGADQSVNELHVAPGPTWTFHDLHTGDGMLWSFGKNHLFWTEDGKRWHNATPQATYFDPAESGPSVSQSSSSCCGGGSHVGGAHKC